MYQLVSAIARPIKAGSRWESLDISQIVLAELASKYEKVYAQLSNPFYQGVKTLDLDDIWTHNPSPVITFSEFLTSIGDDALTVVDHTYSVSTSHAKYVDAIRANYKIEPISPLGHIGSTILVQDRDWLSVTRDQTNIDDLFKYGLFTVNGFIHRTDSDGQRIYVIDGMKSARLSNENQLGITSFAKIGALEFVSIDSSMIYKRDLAVPYKSRMYIDAGVARPDKTPMLVLGGYLHVLDNHTFSQVGDSTFCINFQNFPLRQRYFESVQQIDLDPLGLDHQPSNPVRIDDAELHSDAALAKYATLSQSFLVFIDNPHVFVEREDIPPSDLYNLYISHVKPRWPILVQTGKFSDYWRVYEDKQWAITNRDGQRSNYTFNTVFEEDIVCIDESVPPVNGTTPSRAQFLKIGTDNLVQTGV